MQNKQFLCWLRFNVSKSMGGIFILALIMLFIQNSMADHLNNGNFDYLILSERWLQTSCIDYLQKHPGADVRCHLPQNKQMWAIHGLWPQKGTTKGPFFCNRTWEFNLNELIQIKPDLDLYWPNIEARKTSSSFWSHEWDKHGTCAVSLEALNSEFNYFHKTISLFKQFNMNEIFQKLKIIPSNNGVYVKDIINSIRRMLGKIVHVHCITEAKTNQVYLSEIRLCINKNLDPINCDERENSWKNNSESVDSPSNCPVSLIIYPDKIDNVPLIHKNKEKEGKIQFYSKLIHALKVIKHLMWVFL